MLNIKTVKTKDIQDFAHVQQMLWGEITNSQRSVKICALTHILRYSMPNNQFTS